MSLKKWLTIFFCTFAGAALLIAGFNVAVDPFGVFGDEILSYWTYDMTQNPRVSKIAYIDKNHAKYDSYIIGSSKTSSYSVEKLNKYMNARFYNMIMYGGDLYDAEKTAEYLIDNYEVKNIILNIGIEESVQYNMEDDPTKGNLHAKADNKNKALFYLKYAFLNPTYSTDKLRAYCNHDYMTTKDEVFVPETGVYDKSKRDVENVEEVGNAENFFIYREERNNLYNTDNAVAAVKRVKDKCEKNGINFVLIASPLYDTEIEDYNYDQLCDYWRKLAGVTDFYDFTGYSDISMDSRYFYDDAHFRNSVGDMVLAYIFGDKSVYVPENFGHRTTAENAYKFARERFKKPENAKAVSEYTANVPILMYHALGYDPSNDMVISPELFERDLVALRENGYTTITFDDMRSYTVSGTELPEKPVLITFDDGYASNYEYAFPILQKYNMKATIFAVGVTTGKDTYKDTGKKINPHFTYAQAKEMYESGLIDIQSHTYDLHRVKELDGENFRNGASKAEGETDAEFAALFKADILKSKNEIEKNVGNNVGVLSYPQGEHSELTDVCVRQAGFFATVTVNEAPNVIVKGLPQTLYNLNRIGVYPDMTPEQLVEKIEKNSKNEE